MGDDHDHVISDRRTMYIVLILNFSMFLLEILQGVAADSTALLADSMDFIGDSFSYAITIYALQKHLYIRARVAIIKASLMLLVAAGVLVHGIFNFMAQAVPEYITMGWVGILALIANATSALLLYQSRSRDSNMRSVWLCSRNDMLANIMILLAAYLVFATGSLLPDLLVALGIAYLGSSSAIKIIRHAKEEL